MDLESSRRAGSPPAIEVAGLVRSFGRQRAVDGLDLTVPAGGVYGVLGPNGAGKTTTIRILATLLRPDAGTARVLGLDVVRDADAVRSRISLTGQYASVDPDLTARENLTLLGRLLGLSWTGARARASELLTDLGLGEVRDRLVKTFSGGQRRRLDIAASIVARPQVIFLDEPTTGLDPRSRYQVWDIVRGLVAAGTTVLLTTQYLDEADRLADRIAVVDRGRVIAEGTPSQLKAGVGAGLLRVRLEDPERAAEAGLALAEVLEAPVRADAEPGVLTSPVPDAERAAMVLLHMARRGVGVTEFALGQPSLDQVFLTLTARPAGPAIPKEDVP